MSDEHLRALERRFRETGDPNDGGRWLIARLRSGDLAPSGLMAAAALGEPAALQARELLAAGHVELEDGIYYAGTDGPVYLQVGAVELRDAWTVSAGADHLNIEFNAKALGGMWAVRHTRIGGPGKFAFVVEAEFVRTIPDTPQHPTRCAADGHAWAPLRMLGASGVARRRCTRVGCGEQVEERYVPYEDYVALRDRGE